MALSAFPSSNPSRKTQEGHVEKAREINTEGQELVLHRADSGLILSTPYVLLSTIRSDS